MLPVEPEIFEPFQHIEHDLVRGGVPASDAAWLARFLASRAYAGSTIDEEDESGAANLLLLRLERPLRTVIDAFATAPNREAALFSCLLTLPTISPRYLFDGAAQVQGGLRDRSEWSRNTDLVEQPEVRISRRSAMCLRVLREFRRKERGIDFNVGLAGCKLPSGSTDVNSPVVIVSGYLLARDLLDPVRFLQHERILRPAPETGAIGRADPAAVEFWFDAANELRFSAWRSIKVFIEQAPHAIAGALALQCFGRFHYWLLERTNNSTSRVGRIWILTQSSALNEAPQPEAQESQDLSRAMRAIAKLLGGRVATRPEDHDLKVAWWLYSWRGYLGREKLLSEELRKALVASASEHMGKLRAKVAEVGASALETHVAANDVALRILAAFGSLFRCIKPLLLLLRGLKIACVGDDLRYWHEPGRENPPAPWNWIPERINTFTHAYARYASRKDPELKEFRQDFVQYCLDRLKTKEKKKAPPKAEDMMEQSAAWRYACVRAIRELGIPPRDRGHAVLKWSAEFDPDESVRAAAKVAYDELQLPQAAAEPGSKSSRRGIIAAYWWMRQAHLSALGLPIDKQGANRTFRLEVRRSTQGKEVFE